ncbi:ParA family protein [Lysinibacillus sp. NPDC059133]|uniref:ParA family protein n=1 Tax=Lysinibacillus sp. NPDC059133 TaxID=3346737 RepID=UPI00368C4510
MRVISIINLKGGVAKTISAINIAYTLVKAHGKRVLLIDNDKQGNTSKFFGLHSYEDKSLADLLIDRDCSIESVIKHTAYEGLDIIPANMNLLRANKEILLDVSRPQQTRLRKALSRLTNAYKNEYDYCIIDNAPDINMTVINALVASDDVLVPIKVDKFAFDGLELLVEQIEDVKEFNENITFKGCFVTMFQKNGVNVQGCEYLFSSTSYPLFHTVIRKTVKVDETTFVGKPLLDYKKSTAGQDYEKLVKEYLQMC